MARIDGPKLTSPGKIERKALEPLAVQGKEESDAPGSDFVSAKKKLISTTGGYRPVPIPDALRADLKSFVADQLRGGASAKGAGNTLSIKKMETSAAPTAIKPLALEKELATRSLDDLANRMNTLSPGELTALAKAIQKKEVTNPRVIAAFIEHQQPADRAQSIQKLAPKQLEQIKALMRAGDCSDGVALGVGIRMAAESDWGKAHPAVVKTLQKSYVDGSIRIATKDGDIAGLGMTSASGIDVAKQLRKSPEALAATLAHEGVHKHTNSGCCAANGDAKPQDEIDGMAASADVWGQLGKADDPNLSTKSRTMLNEISSAKKLKTDQPFKDKVLGWYTGFYQDKVDAPTAKVAKGDAAYAASQKPGGKPMPSAALDRLMEQKEQLEYVERTAEAFRTAWKANSP